MLIASGATDKTLLDPLDVLVVGNEQTAILHPLATLVGPNDVPKYFEKEFKKVFSFHLWLIAALPYRFHMVNKVNLPITAPNLPQRLE